ncbi:MAG: CAP domain-containing protein [Candidatus Pseudobacter hemicellulosilyticus]|uniref:CAP domain-containing protein n=1 Tax=Candidatus Pseudobacter hemicellulosilyticus TaxID=3121375 RepID=A0AAJ6BEU8_9BACT|nr:MAG: CAP domain-containing protein [Pseudobacter sp.]
MKTDFIKFHIMTKAMLITLLFFFAFISSHAQLLSQEEEQLYAMIMEYRKEKGLPKIPVSRSLTFVAQTHVKDLAINKPDSGNCNAHSWSSKGKWKACCYTSDHAQAELMWSKPRELTSYKGNGYEIACGSNSCCSDFVMTAAFALQSWKSSKGHNMVMINDGDWGKFSWNAIGLGLYNGFAVVWFGNEMDKE